MSWAEVSKMGGHTHPCELTIGYIVYQYPREIKEIKPYLHNFSFLKNFAFYENVQTECNLIKSQLTRWDFVI